MRSTFSQANSTRFLGTSGLNLLDLRGLGTARTLVLQNGRRHVGGDVLSSGVTPDVNTMPTDLIERVEVVTGGNSAVYGSDAIAGVVNFILKDSYEGLQLRGQGGNSENFRGGQQFQMSPKLDRYNINFLAHFEVTPAFEPFVEAKYSRTDSVGTGASGPAFTQGQTFVDPIQFFLPGGTREQFRLDNPFLSAQARTLICQHRALSGQGCANSSRVAIRENLLGLGARTEEAKRETYRIVGGVRGNFWDDWNYEVAVNYGKLKEETKILGNLDVQRWLLGMDAVDEGQYLNGVANGNIVCASQIDPNRAFGYWPWVYGTDPNAQARLDADVAACVPINPFGGNFSQAVRDYVLLDTIAKGKTKQFNVVGFVSGDTSSFLNLPGGPISFVLGAEYREDDLFYDQDDDVTFGYTFYNAISTFEAPKSKVKEAFGEIRIPILKDTDFFEELEISGAARVSDYSLGNTGTVWAYNFSGIWSPIKDIRFRGNYGRSVRAPNQSELFSPFSQNFAPGFGDPCSSINIGGTPQRAANCAAAGRPGGTDATINPSFGAPGDPVGGPYDFRYSSSLEIRSGGNPTLEAETSDSYTIGTVIQRRFMPGISLSVDYYNITVNDVITGVAAQTIVNQCYDLPAGNPFCDLFERAPPGGAPSGEQEFRIIEGSLIQGPVNFAKLKAKGIDVEAAYRGPLWDLGRLETSLTYTHVLQRSNFLDPTNPDLENRILEELGDPQDAFNWNVNFIRGKFNIGYQMRYIGPMYLNAFEDFEELEAACQPSGCPPFNADWADQMKYPSVFYHDVRAAIDVNKNFNMYLGVDNLTNKEPPLGLTGIGGGSSIYDARGRFYYAGVIAKF